MASFSPPAWGWSAVPASAAVSRRVLPTRVGMVRNLSAAFASCHCSPHPRGDGPSLSMFRRRVMAFSPPAWGWSASENQARSREAVLPHPRGDGPMVGPGCEQIQVFSPPAWGWSGDDNCPRCGGTVLPTRVGMVRGCPRHSLAPHRSPHPRGDGPFRHIVLVQPFMFSPPAWG